MGTEEECGSRIGTLIKNNIYIYFLQSTSNKIFLGPSRKSTLLK